MRSRPWGTIAASITVLLFAVVVFGYAFLADQRNREQEAALAAYTPTATNQDPSKAISGVVERDFAGGVHVSGAEQVAYTQSPPLGGTHDQFWAACTGVVYDRPVRSENLVHSMEHGAVWVAYNPDGLTGDQVTELATRVEDRPYTAMSPYPGLDQPISLQAWGHQLKVTDPADPRIDQFIAALRANQYTHPEVGASCQGLGPGQFDQDQPPPFQPPPPTSAAGQPGVRAEDERVPGAPGMPATDPTSGGGS